MKQIDPKHTEKWIHPEEPEFIVEYRAFVGVLYSQDMEVITRQYINYGVVSVTDNGEEWKVPTGYTWSDIIPTQIQSPVCEEIYQLTKLSQQEVEDLPLPLG
ncbi:MAG: hypothetical protein KAS32_27975 [Candidatus Peribacteraceae bacterium]|nr:hypothetical protein [Candidatus Peribacteraceae bacterium]